MLRKTVLHPEHQRLNARLVDFAGWEMPIQYTSQLDEHHAVRQHAGMFDVAHMTAVDITGKAASAFLQRVLANDVAKLSTPGRALYSAMLNPDGGVIDDLIVYRQDDQRYRLVVNAGTTDTDLDWLQRQADGRDVTVTARRDLGILAVQGPEAVGLASPLLPADLAGPAAALKPFNAVWNDQWFVGRTGYTGEDGFELIVPNADLPDLWRALESAGVTPCGLGARDTLRLEAGMNLYGQDMDETVHPLEAGLGWTIAWTPEDRDFVGRAALERLRTTEHPQFVGLVLEGRGVLRAHMPVRFASDRQGETTSGGFAPTLKRSIALARVDAGAAGNCEVQIRGQWLPCRVVTPPFVRRGQILV
jgi:aminomethyltransferase